MEKKVIDIIEQANMIEKNSNIIIGLSGGADSVSLFHILLAYKKNIAFNIIPVHINHGVRGIESDNDEKFVVELCKKNNLQCKVYRCNIKDMSKELKISEEEAGRKFRYQSFRQEYIEGATNKVAVAHTKDDQGETILMRLFRGSGLKGLCGIDMVNDDIIRPMLSITRGEVERYCYENHFQYKNDSTNDKTIYTRNKIRLELIPYIKENFNENIINTLYRTSNIIREENDYIESIAEEKYDEIVIKNVGEIIIDINLLKKNHRVIIKRIIRKACTDINQNLVDINNKHIMAILSLLDGESGKKINLPFEILVRTSYNNLIFSKRICKESATDFCYTLKENHVTYIKEANFYVTMSKDGIAFLENKRNTYTKIFYYDNINCDFSIRNRKAGDKIFLKHINGSKKIKNYFIDEKIDVNIRDKIPMLAFNNDILWIFDKSNLVNDMYSEIKENKVIIQLWEDNNE